MTTNGNGYRIPFQDLHWMFALCESRDIEPERFGLVSRENTGTFSWNEFIESAATLERFFTDHELRVAGASCWTVAPLLNQARSATLLFQLVDQYQAVFGAYGFYGQNYPLDFQVMREVTRNESELLIRVSAKPGYEDAPAFQHVLAGQLTHLPTLSEYQPARVATEMTSTGATHVVTLPQRNLSAVSHWLVKTLSAPSQHEFANNLQELEQLRRDVALAKDRVPISDGEPSSEHQVAGNDFETLVKTSADAVIAFDESGNNIYVNHSASRLFGFSEDEILLKKISDLIPLALSESRLRTVLEPGSHDNASGIKAKGITKLHQLVPVELTISRIQKGEHTYRAAVIRDVSLRSTLEAERTELENQLTAAQKLESVGQLTAGIAHDFANLLLAIDGYAQLAQTADREELQRHLDEVSAAVARGTQLTKRLLEFTGNQNVGFRPINVSELLLGITSVITRLLPTNVEITINRPEEDLFIRADQIQMEQVLINLAVNARDAMPSGGQLNICGTGTDEEVHISIADSGTGITEDLQSKIFEPLFSTKPQGAGTGLGLSVVKRIVDQHSGVITVDSSPAGTTFTIALPLGHNVPMRQGKRGPLTQTVGGSETILIAEDDAHVRELLRLALVAAGYLVLVARDGKELIEIYKKNSGDIDLVVMNWVLAKLSGSNALATIQQENESQPILVTSAFTIDDQVDLPPNLPLITKPFTILELQHEVRRALDNNQPQLQVNEE